VEAYPTVAAITYPDLSNPQVVAGYLLLAGLFLLKEVASGVLKEAGKELWTWARDTGLRRHRRRCERR
jgi:hypothetical protein